MHNAQERLVTGEETSPTSEGVALEHTLAGVLRQDLNDTTTLGTGSDIPLEVAGGDRKRTEEWERTVEETKKKGNVQGLG